MVAVMAADPGDAGLGRLLGRELGRAMHHQVADRVVAIEERHAGALALDPDVGAQVEAARPDPPDVLRQAKDAVALGAERIGLGH